ncbi:MAG: hypothetical protein ABFS18_01195, partial [Thermodesulfobacteriota bacterium]
VLRGPACPVARIKLQEGNYVVPPQWNILQKAQSLAIIKNIKSQLCSWLRPSHSPGFIPIQALK